MATSARIALVMRAHHDICYSEKPDVFEHERPDVMRLAREYRKKGLPTGPEGVGTFAWLIEIVENRKEG